MTPKTILAAAAALIAVMLVGTGIYYVAFVGLDRMDWRVVQSDGFFVQASGRDARVYEFESQIWPGRVCTAMAFESGGPVGLDCDAPEGTAPDLEAYRARVGRGE